MKHYKGPRRKFYLSVFKVAADLPVTVGRKRSAGSAFCTVISLEISRAVMKYK